MAVATVLADHRYFELQRWSDKNTNIILYYDDGWKPNDCKRFYIKDMDDSSNDCGFNCIEFAIKYVYTIIKMKEDK